MFYPFNYQYHLIKTDPELTHNEQVDDCVQQLRAIKENPEKHGHVVRLNWFYELSINLNCNQIRQWITLAGCEKSVQVTPAYVAQCPTDGTSMELMVTTLPGLNKESIQYKEYAGLKYAVVEEENGKWVYAGGSQDVTPAFSCRKQSMNTFALVKEILVEEAFTLRDLHRQWNFIGDILEQDVGPRGLVQNYQEFNEVRMGYYSNDGFDKDFPAATGIGTRGGGVRIDFIAARYKQRFKGLSLSNPIQQNAHEYSKDQLVGSVRQSTPKFERAKVIFDDRRGYVWVSGTAAIRGEKSIPGTALDQTRITCENIDQLINPDYLNSEGLPGKLSVSPVYIRGYVKHLDDGPAVQEYLRGKYPEALIHVLHADVCRKELLVEIEAEFTVAINP